MSECPCKQRASREPVQGTPREWLEATAVVGTGAVTGALAGAVFGFPYAGAALGTVAGLTVNWKRGCRVCGSHIDSIRAIVGR